MSKKDKTITYDSEYMGHPINTNTDESLGYGCYEEILETTYKTLNSMLSHHSKILVTRFDIRYPSDNSILASNKQIKIFKRDFKRSLDRIKVSGGHTTDPKIIEVSEKTKDSTNPHHHCVVITNANTCKNKFTILNKASYYWEKTLNDEFDKLHENDNEEDKESITRPNTSKLVHYCNEHENGIVLDKSDDEFNAKYDKVFFKLSYLAKAHGKEDRDTRTWLVRSSRLD